MCISQIFSKKLTAMLTVRSCFIVTLISYRYQRKISGMHKPINCNDDGPSTVTKFNAMGIESVYCCDHSTMNYAVTGKAQLFC